MNDEKQIETDGYTAGLMLVAAFLAWIDVFLLLTRYDNAIDPDIFIRSFQ